MGTIFQYCESCFAALFCRLPAAWTEALAKALTVLGSGMAGGILGCLIYLLVRKFGRNEIPGIPR